VEFDRQAWEVISYQADTQKRRSDRWKVPVDANCHGGHGSVSLNPKNDLRVDPRPQRKRKKRKKRNTTITRI
jgi:hypothetical protein